MRISVLDVAILVPCVICTAVCGLAGTLTFLRIIDELNLTRSTKQKIPAIGWRFPSDDFYILSEYRRLHPDGHLIRRLEKLYLSQLFAGTVGSAVWVGFFAALWLGTGGVVLWWFIFGRYTFGTPEY